MPGLLLGLGGRGLGNGGCAWLLQSEWARVDDDDDDDDDGDSTTATVVGLVIAV